VLNAEDRTRFEQMVLLHLDAAFNLAAWILSSRTDAEDVTQDAMLRALEVTYVRGCCRSSATLVIRGWRRIAG
jgi:DNA-directed RNA polymerase specialized sigma24 family protein